MQLVSLDQIRSAIAPLRQQLLQHPVYHDIGSPAALRTFMQHHVFAVWDFMSLLKALQRGLCCIDVPWLPPQRPAAARLINEIVLGEESDDDAHGGHASHFELYLRAMVGFGADTSKIDRLIAGLRRGDTVDAALRHAECGDAVRQFVERTFAIIETNDLCQITSAFTFGREDLLPGVFQKIVDRLDRETHGGLGDFQFYLKRHIDLDGGEHGPMATRLVADLCGNDAAKWQAAEHAATASLTARLAFWDAVHDAIRIGDGAAT